MKRLLFQPLLHFLILGGLLFAARTLWLAPEHDIIAVDETLVQQLRADWRRETGRWPTPVQLQASLDRQLDDERLLREALRLQLDERDAVARARLVANLRFALDDPSTGETHLLRQARHLDLAARDLVVRRRLVQLMQHRLLESRLPREADLQAYVAQHAQRYAQPARYGFEHRYFSADARGESAAAAAQSALALLQSAQPAPAGDSFLLGASFDSLAQHDIATRFGAAFAAALARSPPGSWTGPVASPYGLHLVRVLARQPAQTPDYAAVRTQAAYAWLAQHEPQRLQQALAPLRARYPAQLAPSLLAQGLRA